MHAHTHTPIVLKVTVHFLPHENRVYTDYKHSYIYIERKTMNLLHFGCCLFIGMLQSDDATTKIYLDTNFRSLAHIQRDRESENLIQVKSLSINGSILCCKSLFPRKRIDK